MNELTREQQSSIFLMAFFTIALLFATFLRVSLLFFYPVLVVLLFIGLRWKLDRNALYLLGFAALMWLFSMRNGLYLKYNFVSFYFFLPFMLLLFAVPPKTGEQRNYLKMFMQSLTVLAIINDCTGIIQYIILPNDDSFSGIYGTFTVSQNGLSLINAVLFFYYFVQFQNLRKIKFLLLAGFFLVCMVMGFYGAGLMAVFIALALTFFKVRMNNILQLIFFTTVALVCVVVLMKLVSPATLEYNINIIDRFLHGTGSNMPRKLIIFQHYVNGYTNNLLDFFFGSGPGTFNSRSAFMVGSPTYFNVQFIKSTLQPFYFTNYAYVLWNPSNTGPYDGFMNQPFSSLLALLGEYGLIFTLLAVYLVFSKFSFIVKGGNMFAKSQGVAPELKLYKFCSILALLLFVIDNYMEYPEIIALLLIIVKLSQQRLRQALDL